MQPPPGGPPDYSPPTLLSVAPDSGAVVESWRDPVVFQFDEVIDERSGGGLDRLILVSPLPKAVEIDWRRKAIAVKPAEGWRAGTTYHVRLEPGLNDLRGNRLTTGKTVVFSTGGPPPTATVSGTVVDWEARRLQPRALVQAVLLPDSLAYVGLADSAGDFSLGALPAGRYLVAAVVDANNNRRRDGREAFDSVTIQLDSVAHRTFWVFRHDTVGPSLSRASMVDSQTLRLEFSQPLALSRPDSSAVSVLALPDSQALPIKAVLLQAEYDSLRAGAASATRAAGTDTATADTLARVEGVAPPPPPTGAVAAPPGAPSGVPVAAPAGRAQVADTGRVATILAERPRLSTGLVVQLDAALMPGSRYVVVASVTNLNGAANTSRTLLIVPERAAAER
ncbi:MAG TPA: Ig-like domain-containing protein [Gemmatimonadales bacterium]|nr:Ig-like domain-containing protein [Gemmatimonadales bacterium]